MRYWDIRDHRLRFIGFERLFRLCLCGAQKLCFEFTVLMYN